MKSWFNSLFAGAVLVLAGVIAQAALAADHVRVGYVKGWGPHIVVKVAKDAGLFEKAGIDAEILAFGGGGPAGEALAAGAVDVASVPIFALAPAIKRGLDARMVSQNSETAAGMYLLVLPDSPFKTVKDLDGKKVGISAAGSTTDALARFIANKYGVTFTTVAVGVTMLPALARKQVDAVIGYPLMGDQALLDRTAVALSDFSKDVPANTDDLWVATGPMIKNRPEVLRRVLSALHGATALLQNDRPYALKAIKDFMGEQVSNDAVNVLYDSRIMKMSIDGKINPDSVAANVKLLLATGIDPSGVASPTDIYVTDFTPVVPLKP